METDRTYTAFAGNRLIASAELTAMLLRTKAALDNGEATPILIFDDQTGEQVDFDFRGTPDQVLETLQSHPSFAPAKAPEVRRAGPGRPRLGVVCREVSLLPRHWKWLEQQPQGISGALRKLVDESAKREPDQERARLARDAAAKFMWTMAGNLPHFEEASRALFAKDQGRFEELIRDWPDDIRSHVSRLVQKALQLETTPPPSPSL